MTRRLLATYLTITAVVLAALVVPLGLRFADHERDQLMIDIERDAIVVASLVEDALEEGTTPAIDTTLAEYGNGDGRIVVVDAEGISLIDSADPDDGRRDFSSRPEIAEAIDGRRAVGTRYSETLDVNLMYVTVPVASGGVVHGAVRITYPTSTMDARVRSVWIQLGVLSSVVLVTVALVGWLLARSVTGPVRRMQSASAALASGDFSVRVPDDVGAPELRSLATTFNETALRLEALVESQRRFVADASHQLRTPLTALRLRLENFEPHLPESELPKLDAAVDELERLARLVDGLLVLARTEGTEPHRTSVDVAEIVTDRVEALRAAAADRSVRLTAEVPLEPPTAALAVPGALEQVVDNLVSNAVEVSPADGEVVVAVVAGADRPWVRVSVTDQGPGMDAGARARAFDRFWRAPTSHHAGSGLGLAIVAELVEASGGQITLEDGPGGRGLTAVVDLEATAAPVSRPDQAAPQGLEPTPASGS